jgi:Heterokaryon incompatibility protein (HET)
MQRSPWNQGLTNSEENFELIRSWLNDCTKKHDCSAWSLGGNRGRGRNPSRLVDVHDVASPCLVETADLDEAVQYLTLSHCWGSWRHATMKMADLENFKREIPEHVLQSTTFQQAFDITRRLEARYIWIDSLCIAQDDAADWSRESAHMSEVYGHSLLNLVAAHARDGRDGCFARRDILTVRPSKIPNPFNSSSNDYFLVYPIRMDKIYEEQVLASPIYKRAWILQERLLSARSVYFGKNQLVWTCGALEACEAFPNGANYISTLPHNRIPMDKQGVGLLLNQGVTSEANKLQRLAEAWARVVKMYTSASLTRSSDKLVALQGIAARAQEHFGGRYLAGLWQRNDDDMLWSLLWFVESGDKNRQAPEKYRAPSWSWANVDGRIEMSTPDPWWRQKIFNQQLTMTFAPVLPADVKILNVYTQLAEPALAPYGSVTGGELLLRGRLFQARVSIIAEDNIFAYQFFDAELYALGRGEEDPFCSCHLDVPARSVSGDIVTCLPLITEKERKKGGFTGSSRVHGLILEKCDGYYRRIGHFTTPTARRFEWMREPDLEAVKIL